MKEILQPKFGDEEELKQTIREYIDTYKEDEDVVHKFVGTEEFIIQLQAFCQQYMQQTNKKITMMVSEDPKTNDWALIL